MTKPFNSPRHKGVFDPRHPFNALITFVVRYYIAPVLAWVCRRYMTLPFQRGGWRLQRLTDKIVFSSVMGPRRVRTRFGFSMEVDPKDFLQRQIYITGQWEPEVTTAVKQTLRPGDVFIDIGANVGYFSLLASRLLGSHGQVLAFEPQPSVFRCLRYNVEANRASNVRLFPFALVDKRTNVKIFSNDSTNAGRSALFPENGSTGFVVEGRALDEIIQKNPDFRVTAVKIDVEGAETRALKGATELLRHYHPDILCEISEWSLLRMGSSREELISLLTALGYTWKKISPSRIGSKIGGRVYEQFDAHFIHESRLNT